MKIQRRSRKRKSGKIEAATGSPGNVTIATRVRQILLYLPETRKEQEISSRQSMENNNESFGALALSVYFSLEKGNQTVQKDQLSSLTNKKAFFTTNDLFAGSVSSFQPGFRNPQFF